MPTITRTRVKWFQALAVLGSLALLVGGVAGVRAFVAIANETAETEQQCAAALDASFEASRDARLTIIEANNTLDAMVEATNSHDTPEQVAIKTARNSVTGTMHDTTCENRAEAAAITARAAETRATTQDLQRALEENAPH